MLQPVRFRSGIVVRLLLFVLALLLVPYSVSIAQPTFTDVTVSAGVSYIQQTPLLFPGCIFGAFCEPERMTGGAAVGDVDGDGDLDLYVTLLDAPDILFLNQGDGTFQDGTSALGLDLFDRQSNGAAFGDVDNDGDQDLYVSVMGAAGDAANNHNYLFINNGFTFSEQSGTRGAGMASTSDRRLYSVTLGDYDRDGYLDLHAVEWLEPSVSHSRLLHNRGVSSPGYFDDVTALAGVDLTNVEGFSSTFTDLDGDRWPDLVVAGDFGTSRLFWNNGDGTFADGTVAAGVGTDENGMGSAFGDVDGDGDLDWFVTSIFDGDETCEAQACNWGYTGNRLYRNEGGRVFSDATDASGVRDGYWGWGTLFFDYDNDGDLDLVMVNGVDFSETEADTKYVNDPMRFWENDGTGVMTEKSSAVGLTDTRSGKGLLTFDYDDDGDLDLFVVNNAAGPRLYRNDGGNAKGWLRVQTVGSVSNRDGLGAWITLQVSSGGPVQVREMGTAGHFLGQSERVAHFGLGDGVSPVHKVTVKWPSGAVQEFLDVARNTTLVASEPACGSPLPACPGSGTAGSVPDGWAGTPGAPLKVEHASGNSLKLSWSGSCDPTDTDYHVYEGTLGDFTSHAPATCGTAGSTHTTLLPAAGDTYYLVVPADGGVEGSYGRKGDHTPRSPGGSACLPQAVGVCS